MSDFLTPQQIELRDAARAFAADELDSDVHERDRDGRFSRENWDRCGAHGILGSHVPEEYGGRGLGALDTVVWMEALGYGSRDNGLTLALGGQMWSVQEPIQIYGSDEQRRMYLPKLVSGEWIGAHGVSEPGSGSDALSLSTVAERRDDGYVLNGRKTYIGMGPEADLTLVLANTDPDSGKWGVSAFLVEKGTPGFTQSAARGKAGTRTNPIGDLVLEDCFVSEGQRLGEEGIGVSLFSRTICWERAFIHAGHLGSMERLVEICVTYAQEREQFGVPIGNFQAVSHRIANMKLRQQTSRLLVHKVARMKDLELNAETECAMAKLHVSESLLESSLDAVRIHGAKGYLSEFEIERELRDSFGGVIYAGTSDIQRNLIAQIAGV